MKRLLIITLIIFFVLPALSQTKTRGRVKRKYRDVERVQEVLPQVAFRGIVRDAARDPIPGASIEIEGLRALVHSNERGEFILTGLPTDRLRIRVSCLGYYTKSLDYVMQQGFNDHYITLERGPVPLEPAVTTARNRVQHIADVPAPVTVISRSYAERLSLTGFPGLTETHPGIWAVPAGSGGTHVSAQGSVGGSFLFGESPSVALYIDQVPVSQPDGFSSQLFDVERVELLSGAQNTLFGRDAQMGAVHLISRRPESGFGGYVSAGTGSYGHKEIEGVINVPLVEDMLFIRAGGVYRDCDGFVNNTSGGRLNGMNTMGGRFSLRFLPFFNHRIVLQMNYRKSDEPGAAFLNPWFTGEGDAGSPDEMRASLNRGSALGREQELSDATLTYTYYRDEHNHWTSVTSMRKTDGTFRRDADGSSLSALEWDQAGAQDRFFQEIRYSFMRYSRTNGSAGVNYLQERGDYSHSLRTNDRHIFDLLTGTGSFILPGETPFPVHPTPLEPIPAAGMALSGDHFESFFNRQEIRSAQAYFHVDHQWKRRLFLHGGVRVMFDRTEIAVDSVSSGGDPSALGVYTGVSPNLLFYPSDPQQISKNSLSLAGTAGFSFRYTENFNLFVHAVRGIKPPVTYYSSEGLLLMYDAEKVYGLEGGWKTTILKRVFWDVHGFYRRHFDVQVRATGESVPPGSVDTHGIGTSYGIESGLKAAVMPGLDLFGRYRWMESAFDSIGMDNSPYFYAGNQFARSPEHSFSAGFSSRMNIAHRLHLFASPWYSWKSHFWFTEANSSGMGQSAYGLLNVSCGLELDEPSVVLTFYGSNLLDERYVDGVDPLGGQIGLPGRMPGGGRMLGVKVVWKMPGRYPGVK